MTIKMEENTENREVWIKTIWRKGRKITNKQTNKQTKQTIGNGNETRVGGHCLGIS